MRRLPLPALALLFAGCAAIGNGGGSAWTKPGADAAATARDYADCQAMAASAVRTEGDIDEDIAATRGGDWQRTGAGRVETRTMRDHTRDRAAGIVESCMRAKGFTPPR